METRTDDQRRGGEAIRGNGDSEATDPIRRDYRPGGAYAKPGAFGVMRRTLTELLTPRGNLFLRARLGPEQKVVRWQNGEGHAIEGLLTTPPWEWGKR